MLDAPESGSRRAASAGTGEVRPWSTAAVAAAATAAAIGVVWLAVRQPLAAAIDNGLDVPWFGVAVRTFGAEPLAVVDRAALLAAILGTALAAMIGRRPGLLYGFVFTPASPIDLGVVRIVIFGVVALLPRVRDAVAFSSFPENLQTAPAGMPWLLDLVPAVPSVVTPAAVAFVVASLLACIGLWTRPAAVTATVLGLYVLGVPQFYGKVTHYHILWWVMAVLAASRCGDALSVDAMRQAWRRGDRADAVPNPSTAYGTPIRVIWLLIALTYLFPGAWKWISAGTEWAFSDNVRLIMYEHWSRLEGFTPPVPVDEWPLAYMLAGATVIIFELSFIFMLFNRRTRVVAVVFGLVFHALNFAFLRLSFVTLQVCYVAFVPWNRVMGRSGERMGPVDVVAGSGRARRLVAAFAAVDVFDVIAVRADGGPLRVRAGKTGAEEWDAVRLLNRRLPATWPLVPLTHIVPASVGDRWLRVIDAESPGEATKRSTPGRPIAVACVAAVIIGANTLAGVGAVTSAWPFACYPTFAGIEPDHRDELTLVFDRPGVGNVTLEAAELRRLVNWEKLDGMARAVVWGAADGRRRAISLIDLVVEAGVAAPPGTQVEVYSVRTSLIPGISDGEPELLFTVER